MALDDRHRAFRPLPPAVLAVGAMPILLHLSVADPTALASAYFGWTVALYLYAAAATLVVALSFSPGELLRPGWLLLSASYALLLPTRLLAGPVPFLPGSGPDRLPALVALLGVSSGLLSTIGFITMARAWRASGLDTSTRASQRAARLAALAVAVALAGTDLVERLPAALSGDALAATDVITDLLDGVLFVVAVPVLRAALALGGGALAWPWLLLTASLLAWLGYDAALIWGEAVGLTAGPARLVEEVLRSIAAASAMAAAVAQRTVMLRAAALGAAHRAA